MSETQDTIEAADGQSSLTDGLDAGAVAASTKRYRITYLHEHKTLMIGDVVVMTESPQLDNLLLRVPDMTLHRLRDDNGQYVHMIEVPNAGLGTENTMEKILEIKDYEGKDDYSNVAGFEVVTTAQSVKLFIDNDSSCCERWGHFWCNDDPQDFIGAELRGVRLTDTALHEAKMEANDLDDKYFEGAVMFVNLDTDRGVLQFVAYNEHNGYYGHEAKVQCTQLTHAEIL